LHGATCLSEPECRTPLTSFSITIAAIITVMSVYILTVFISVINTGVIITAIITAIIITRMQNITSVIITATIYCHVNLDFQSEDNVSAASSLPFGVVVASSSS
jgi:hypothetical protein